MKPNAVSSSSARARVTPASKAERASADAWLETERLEQSATGALERIERFGLTAGAIERSHQLAPTPLAEWIVHDMPLDDREQLVVLTQSESGVYEVLLSRPDRPFDAERVLAGERPLDELRQRRTTVQRQRATKAARCLRCLTSRQRVATLRREALKRSQVDRVGSDVEEVART